MLDGTENAIRFTERPNFFELFGCQQIHFDADGFSNPSIIHKLIPAILGAGQADVGHFLETHILACFNFKLLIEFHRIFMNLSNGIRHVEQRQQTRGVPSGTRCQLFALNQYDIAPAFFGKMIKR